MPLSGFSISAPKKAQQEVVLYHNERNRYDLAAMPYGYINLLDHTFEQTTKTNKKGCSKYRNNATNKQSEKIMKINEQKLIPHS